MGRIVDFTVAWTALAGAALTLAFPAFGQDALDRTDPSLEEPLEPVPFEEAATTAVERPEIDAPSGADAQATYEVGPIVIENLVALSPSDFTDIIGRFSARTVTEDELRGLSDRIAERARERGYVFASAYVAPQDLTGGVLRVRVEEGAIDELRIEGLDDPAVRSRLAPLLQAGPVNMARLERQVLLADDIAGVRMRDPRFEWKDGRGILSIAASRNRFAGRAELANDGSQPIGPLRARFDLDANGLLTPLDELDLTYSTVPDSPGELQYVRGRYGVIFTPEGTEFAAVASYSATEPGAYLEDRGIFGKSLRIGAQLRHPLARSNDFSLWLDGEFEYRDLRQERLDVLAREDRVPAIRAGLYTRALLLDGSLRARLTVSQGLDILDATPAGDRLASRRDASPDFTTFAAYAEWERELSDTIEIAFAGRGQLATTPLLITEDFGLGGNDFLRGYNFNERSGDNGIAGFAELRYDIGDPLGIVRRMQLYAYADGGVVGNLQGGRGSGSLASSGGGIRTDITRDLGLDLELAVPLTGPRYDTGDSSPRFNVALRRSF